MPLTNSSKKFLSLISWPWILRRLVVLLPLLSLGCADSLVLEPDRQQLNAGVATRRTVAVHGRTVESWVTRSPGAKARNPEAFVLFYVGKGDRADRWVAEVASAWGDKPVEVWGMNYGGSGGSDGPPRLTDVSPDALAVFDCVHAIATGRPIFIHAGSFGTTAALSVAARRPVAGLVLDNPPPLRQLILGEYGWWNLWLVASIVAIQIPADLDTIANARHCRSPAVFILSESDEVIPPKYHEMVLGAYAGPKRVIRMPGALHNDPLTHEAAMQFAAGLDWLWTRAQPNSPVK
jgi:hypothetical protein